MISFLLPACSKIIEEIPPGVIEEEKMVEIFTDIRLAEGEYRILSQNGYSGTDYIDSCYQVIYKMHQVENWQVDSSMSYYSRKPEVLQKIFKKAADNITDLGLDKN